MSQITLQVSSRFSGDLEALRRLCFSHEYGGGSTADLFDERAWFPTVSIDGVLAASARVTLGPANVFETWSRGAAAIPSGSQVADLGRAMVAPAFRGSELFELVSLLAFRVAGLLGCHTAVAATTVGRHLNQRLIELGLRPAGPPVPLFVSPAAEGVNAQMYVANVDPQFYEGRLRAAIAKLEGDGHTVVDTCRLEGHDFAG